MAKPAGPACNLDCRYCFYLEKESLFPGHGRGALRMSDEVLEAYIRQQIAAQPVGEIHFAWQGGEPTLSGIQFFERAVALQRLHAAGRPVRNALQTNGTLLDDAWGEFLRRENFLVGLSIDGPRDLHDAYRVDKGGKPTFDKVMRGLRVLQAHGVEFNTLTVVHRESARRPLEVYQFLKDIGSSFLQFIPLVDLARRPDPPARGKSVSPAQTKAFELPKPPTPALPTAPTRATAARVPTASTASVPTVERASTVLCWSVLPEDYGEFLVSIFDEWVRHDVGRVFVQLFDVSLGIWMGYPAGLCLFRDTCGDAVALEHNGDVFACDHFVHPGFRLGNLLNTALGDLVASPRQRAFGRAKRDALPAYCRTCDVRFACNGECPKNRIALTPDGEAGLNYLCPAYRRFFRHIDPAMRGMAWLARHGRPPAEIMTRGVPPRRQPA